MDVTDSHSCTLTNSDAESGDTLTLSFGSAIAFGSISGNTVTLNPTLLAQIGSYTVHVDVTDDNSVLDTGGVLTTSMSFTIDVYALNAAPSIDSEDCVTTIL